MKLRQWVPGLVLIGALACSGEAAGPAEIPQTAVQLETTELLSLQSVWSGYDTPARILIQDEARWVEAWDRIHRHVVPKPPRPEHVDFARSTIILAAQGQRPTGGYSIEISEARRQEGVLYVRLIERSPGAGCGTYQALTAPVHAVSIPKHTGSVFFIVQKQTVQC